MSRTPGRHTAFVLLAAGASLRMGEPKQLLHFRGRPLLRHAAATAIEAGCTPVIVVLGARAKDVGDALAGLPVQIVVNDQWAEGVGTSIQAGLRQLESAPGIQAVVLGLGDQPFVTADVLAQIVATRAESGKAIVASRYSGTVGVPACFAREAIPLLMALAPDEGCKGVILSQRDNVLLVDCPEAAIDIDTPDDYIRAGAHRQHDAPQSQG